MRICEVVATQASLILEIYYAVYGPWNNMLYVQKCVWELQGKGKIAVQLSE